MKNFIQVHRIWSLIILIAVVGVIDYSYYKIKGNSTPTTYVMATAAKETVIAMVTGTGQVSASNQVELKSKVSANITSVFVNDGQQVKAGTLLVTLDSLDAQKAVRDAQANLTSAKLSLDKLQQPADTLTLLQNQNALDQANQAKSQAQSNLQTAYTSGFNALTSAYLALPDIITGINTIMFSSTYDRNLQNYLWYANQTSLTVSGERDKANSLRDNFFNSYQTAYASYTAGFNDYKQIDRTATSSVIEAKLSATYQMVVQVSDMLKNAINYIDFVTNSISSRGQNSPTQITSDRSNINSYATTINSQLTSLLNIIQTITNANNTLINAEATIAEKTESLAKLKAGTDPLDIQAQQLSITKAQNSLLDAQQQLADYYIRAPFDGKVAKVNVKVGDSSSGSSLVTFITQQSIAEIPFNEVDIAKIKVGQKVNMTFDAVSDLNITGKVLEIDSIGTVSQGVVTYNVKIGFDTEDSRVLPGMSVNADIITDVHQNVLTVPNGAIKTQGTRKYVLMFNPSITANLQGQNLSTTVTPTQQTVTTDLADDTNTEIISGLNENDIVVERSITTATATTSQAPSILNAAGGNNRGFGNGNATFRTTTGGR